MRMEKNNAALTVKAISGTHVVLLAFKPAQAAAADLRGFAIQRSTAGGQKFWLKGIKFFDGSVASPVRGAEYSSQEQPFQTFFWSDYAATPGTTYTYSIVPRLGTPGSLRDGEAIDIAITTEPEDDGKHGVWFNRGIVASHKFAQKFQNAPLTDEMANNVNAQGKLLSEEAAWLSRGLAEACLAYINGTKAGEGLRVCAYEFTWAPVLEALKRAVDRGVDVQIIYHAVDDNKKALAAAGIPDHILTERTRPPIPHNKFIVKIVGGKPRHVWTGSTNFTSTGFMGQTNVGHLVTDDKVAETYLKYWTGLQGNPTVKNALALATSLTPNPANAIAKDSTELFYSPRIADNMLDWYAMRIRDACTLAMITLPFNVAKQILAGLDEARRSLRLVILETEPDKFVIDAEKRNAGKLAFSNGAILGKIFLHNKAGGAKVAPISQGKLDDWFIKEELARPTNTGHVFFLHAKILLIDPLSDDPLVCTGSANFSSNSLVSNDENMLLIRGNTRVADIYLTELDRIFKHFHDRNAINRGALAGEQRDLIHLDTTQAWIDGNFKPGSYKNSRLMTFFPEAASDCAWSANGGADPDIFADEALKG